MIPNKSCGHYFGDYEIEIKEYSGEDFSRRCFIFPGQGSATPGMFRQQYSDFESIRKKFEQADELARKNNLQKISDYILDPKNISKDKLPIIRNLALFTMEVALHEVFAAKKIIPKVVTGHSFGEYAALVVSGTISFEEMFDVVYKRDLFCPEANSLGFMIAVGADEKEIKNILKKEEFYVSNLNSHEQTVVSVSPNIVSDIEKILKENKIAYKILADVPQPYHSPYLNDVKKRVEEYIRSKKINFQKPQIPLFSSVTQKLIDENNFKADDIKNILINQIVAPVNFVAQISAIYELRCFNFIEINEKRTFSFFVRNILADKEIKTDFAAHILKSEKKKTSKYLSPENSKLFSMVSRIIGEITGYEIEKISFEDRYQEDLGIDSIKKADILLTVLNESEINPGEDFNTSEFGSIKDTVDYLKNAEKGSSLVGDLNVKKETFFERYAFVWEEKALEDYFLLPDKENKQIIFNLEDIFTDREKTLEKIEQFFKENKGQRLDIITQANYMDFDYGKTISFFDFWKFLLKTIENEKFNLVLTSFGKTCACVEGYASFFKSMKKELPSMFFKNIHFENEIAKEELLALVRKELREPLEIDVLYRKDKRFVSVRKNAEKPKDSFELDLNSVVVAIGGAKGITFSLLKNISKKYKPVIFLVGKSEKENKIVAANIEELKKNNSEVCYESLDARDEKVLDKLFSKIKNKHKKIDLIINGAGTVDVSFIKNKSKEEAERELSNKVMPALNVLRMAKKYEARKVINFSSVISKYGSAGQSIYTMANAIINHATLEHDFGSVVHWPPWNGVGMTEQKGILKNLNENGVSLLDSEKADELFSFDFNACNSKAVYYMDQEDDSLYGFSLNNFSNRESLIGKITKPFNISAQNPIFEKDFDLSKDSYLKDHKIKDMSYVPAAVGATMFFCLAEIYNKEFPVLENIVIRNPIIVKDVPLKCQLKIEKKKDVYEFFIKSNAINFSCQTGNRNDQTRKTVNYAVGESQKEILVESIYSDYYFKDSLYLGPIFQTIERAFLDEKDNPFFRVDNSKLLPVLGYGFYDKLVQWIDVSFQALSAIGLKNNLKFIPIKVSKLTTFFHNEISNYLYVIPFLTKFDATDIRGDVVVVNEKGEVLIEMKDVFLKSINEHAENRLKIVEYKEK